MKALFSGILVAAAMATTGLVAQADESNTSSSTVLHLVCRSAAGNETPTARTTDNNPLFCTPLDMAKIMAMKPAIMAMPDGATKWRDLSKALLFMYSL